jgi:phospholipase/carboxylesterase
MTPIARALSPAVVGVPLAGRVAAGERYAWAAVDREDRAGFATSASAVTEWLGALDGWSSVGLVGFSQGGAVALEMLRARPGRYAYVVTLSGFLVRARDPRDAAVVVARPPVLCGRGERDDVIPSAWSDRLERWLDRCTTPTVHRYPDLGHTMHAAEVADVAAFVRRVTG